MTADQWFRLRGFDELSARNALLSDLNNVSPDLSFDVRDRDVLVVRAVGCQREDRSYAWKMEFTIVGASSESEFTGLFIQAFSGLALPIELLTGILLCNAVKSAQRLGVSRVRATPRPANSIAHLRAGFLPDQASWTNLRLRLLKELSLLPLRPGEEGAKAHIETVLQDERPVIFRRLIHVPGDQPSIGAAYPETTRALLTGSGAAWLGSLHINDEQSLRYFERFAAAVDPFRGS
jgi:hypothetical protein